MFISKHRANVRTIRNLQENEGITLRYGRIVRYKTGWQVGITGYECHTPEEVSILLHTTLKDERDVGVWRSQNIYYVDKGRHITTKREAVEVGREADQQSIYDWAKDLLFWL
jgi:hypothetical protein